MSNFWENPAPKKIKQSITGKGFSSKEQVRSMVCQILSLKHAPQSLDASDALAVAICHCFKKGNNTETDKKTNYKDWSDYIEKNQK